MMGVRIKGVQATLGLGIAAALVMAGCSFGRSGPATSPRAQAQEAPLPKDLATLRQENDALKQEQLQNARQIEALQKQLAAQQAEQKRFREMMSTNFDLLEQSVALTLSKSIDKSNDRSADSGGTAKAPAAAQMTAPVARSAGSSTSAASKTPVAAPAPAPAPAGVKPAAEETIAPREAPEAAQPAPMDTPKAIGQTHKPAPVAMSAAQAAKPQSAPPTAAHAAPGAAAQKPAPKPLVPAAASAPAAAAAQPPSFNDPDLTPPKHPKTLTANRAAKALYERGFALYANRQYDQAVLVYQNFLSRYPEDIYSDNAQFWIGESFLNMDKLADAETAYRKVLREYEHKNSLEGYKTPEAIYRLGTLAGKRNDTPKARYYYGNVAGRYPESSAGRKAQRELEGKPQTTAQSEGDDEKSGG
jgi:tol-pal system protein YbgF